MSADIALRVTGKGRILQDRCRPPGTKDSQMKGHFDQIGVHPLHRQPAQKRRIGSLPHLRARIKDQKFLLRRPIKKPAVVPLLHPDGRIRNKRLCGSFLRMIINRYICKKSDPRGEDQACGCEQQDPEDTPGGFMRTMGEGCSIFHEFKRLRQVVLIKIIITHTLTL